MTALLPNDEDIRLDVPLGPSAIAVVVAYVVLTTALLLLLALGVVG